jgi:hypothetical protein
MKLEPMTLDDLAGIIMLAERADEAGIFPHPGNGTSLRRFRLAYDRCAEIEHSEKQKAPDKRKRKATRFEIVPLLVERSETRPENSSPSEANKKGNLKTRHERKTPIQPRPFSI